MGTDLPQPDVLWQAIDLYLKEAYGGPPRRDVQQRVDELKSQPPGEAFGCRAVEQDKDKPGCYRVRLGNKFYPHMKLLVQASPDGHGYLFKCDTHDRHCCPAVGSRDYAAFLQLIQINEEIARRIEAAWDEAGVPTFKKYLRDDLARRRTANKTVS